MSEGCGQSLLVVMPLHVRTHRVAAREGLVAMGAGDGIPDMCSNVTPNPIPSALLAAGPSGCKPFTIQLPIRGALHIMLTTHVDHEFVKVCEALVTRNTRDKPLALIAVIVCCWSRSRSGRLFVTCLDHVV